MEEHPPQREKLRPTDSTLLKKCEPPAVRLDETKSLDDNGPALADLARAFKECQARQGRLVDWFD